MDYITAKEAADLWGISQIRVAVLCSDGFIPKAEKKSNIWFIPKDAPKPNNIINPKLLKEQKVKPFLKWAGGKGQLLEQIKKYYPSELGKSINKYAEPFVGGGAVLFDILSNYNIDEVYIGDSNKELINVYITLRDSIDELIPILRKYEQEYLPLDNEQRKQNIELASLLIFLNRTCFNGLYRVNSKGEYNVPMGAYKSPTICDENNLRNVSKALKDVIIYCADYKVSEKFIDDHTFAYFDPPYRPLTSSSSFTAYTENDFDDNKQKELGMFIKKMSSKGAYIVASNSDPKNINAEDNFFDDLYSGLEINRIYASRMINSNASARGKISELLICNRGNS